MYQEMNKVSAGGCAVLVAALVAVAAVFGHLLRFLWNAVMPELFGLPELGFWQALILLALTGLLFRRGGTSRVS